MSGKPGKLADEKMAVSLFLESLLREPEPVEEQIQTHPPVYEVKTEQPVVAEKPVLPVTEQVETVIERDVVEQLPEQEWQPVFDSGLPDWHNEPFQALLFKVAGLTLAVPLAELNGVVEWTDAVTEMPGHADFYMGILQHLGESVAVIDTARLVFPRDKLVTLAGDNPRERVKRIVLIGDGKWGLACDEVDEVITLQPDDVRWRTNRTTRYWLLGTVIEHMCALLDVAGFERMLVEGQ